MEGQKVVRVQSQRIQLPCTKGNKGKQGTEHSFYSFLGGTEEPGTEHSFYSFLGGTGDGALILLIFEGKSSGSPPPFQWRESHV